MLCMDCYSACPPVLSLLLVHLDALHPAPHGLITIAEAFPRPQSVDPKCSCSCIVTHVREQAGFQSRLAGR